MSKKLILLISLLFFSNLSYAFEGGLLIGEKRGSISISDKSINLDFKQYGFFIASKINSNIKIKTSISLYENPLDIKMVEMNIHPSYQFPIKRVENLFINAGGLFSLVNYKEKSAVHSIESSGYSYGLFVSSEYSFEKIKIELSYEFKEIILDGVYTQKESLSLQGFTLYLSHSF